MIKLKYYKLPSLLLLLLLTTGCSQHNTKHKLSPKNLLKNDKEYIFPNVDKCSNLYTNGSFSILEVHCSNSKDGLYLFEPKYVKKFNWYNKKFNLWATVEGCADEESCFYEIKTDNNIIIEFKYNYYINLSKGFYKIKVVDKELKIIEEQSINFPS